MPRSSFIVIGNPGIMTQTLVVLWAGEDGKLDLDLSPAPSSFPHFLGIPGSQNQCFKILLEGEHR